MANVYDVEAADLVQKAAGMLKEKIKKPEYVDFVKSGAGKERPPEDPDFWYVRSASILRQVYLNGPIGVSKLRIRYGNRKAHTVHRKHMVPAGGSIIRNSFKQLEEAKLIKRTPSGRVITPAGKAFLDKISKEIVGN